jgi:hexosaminidase
VLAGLDPDCLADADASGITLSTVTVVVASPTVPNATSLGTDESYSLNVTTTSASIRAKTYVGVLRALETFSQLVISTGANSQGDAPIFSIPHLPWTISEAPSFAHRGVLLDPARTFISIPTLEATVDALLFSKMNVLHLHLTDSQAIAFDLPSLPAISRAAAYSEDQQYNATAVAGLVEYARVRGVRVLAELDSPGHARSWGLAEGYSDIVSCADVPGGLYTRCAHPHRMQAHLPDTAWAEHATRLGPWIAWGWCVACLACYTGA